MIAPGAPDSDNVLPKTESWTINILTDGIDPYVAGQPGEETESCGHLKRPGHNPPRESGPEKNFLFLSLVTH